MRHVVVLTLTAVFYWPVAVAMLVVLTLRYVVQHVADHRHARAGPRMSAEWHEDFEARMSEHRWNVAVHGQTV